MDMNIYKIRNSKVICRVLPFFARGRRMILFLEAVASPLIKLHDAFLRWGFEIIVKLKMTSQESVLIWYLNYRFRDLFVDDSGSFEIFEDSLSRYLLALNVSEINRFYDIGGRIYNTNEVGLDAKPIKYLKRDSISSECVINAPTINETSDYTNKQYLHDIRKIVNEYMTVFIKYTIIIGS